MKVLSDWSQKTLYDVIAKMRGAQEPDRWIIRGNHHDGWVFGAADPLSGPGGVDGGSQGDRQVGQGGLAAAPHPGLHQLGRRGAGSAWVRPSGPKRMPRSCKAKAVLYVNSDVNGRGFLGAEGSHALQHFVSEAARDVKDPETGGSVLGARRGAKERVARYEGGARVTAAMRARELELGALGSGSDYTPFLQHLGVNSLDLGFDGETDYGVYHSAYDSFDHFRRFVDPTFEYGVALAKVAGRLMLRAAQAQLMPAQRKRFRRFGRRLTTRNCTSWPTACARRRVELSKAAGRRRLQAGRRSGAAARRAAARRGEVPYLEFRRARQCRREARAQRQGVRRGICAPCSRRSAAAVPRMRAAQCSADATSSKP